MKKNFAIRSASLICQYGEDTSELKPFLDRRIQVNHKNMANASDIGNFNVCGGFGRCISPHRWNGEGELPPCIFKGLMPWQGVNNTVHIGKERYGALMEDGWTVCDDGFGIVSLMNSGQPDENHVEEILKKLEELERVVDEFMEINDLPKEYRDNLLESILLWQGYGNNNICWEYNSSLATRGIFAYLNEKYPSLANYFSNGLYVTDKNGEIIDLNYLLGINKALNTWNGAHAYVTEGMLYNRGMYNAYLEACRQQRGQGVSEALGSFLEYFMGDSYDAGGRYTQYYDDYYDVVDDELRYRYFLESGINQDSLSVTQQDEEVIKGTIASQLQDQGKYDADTSKIISEIFVKQLQEDVKKGG